MTYFDLSYQYPTTSIRKIVLLGAREEMLIGFSRVRIWGYWGGNPEVHLWF